MKQDYYDNTALCKSASRGKNKLRLDKSRVKYDLRNYCFAAVVLIATNKVEYNIYAIARLSVVFLSSLTFVRPTMSPNIKMTTDSLSLELTFDE